MGALACATPAGATFPGANGKIFYSSNVTAIQTGEGTRDLWRINPDGTGAQRLTGLTPPFDQGDEDKPAVSPDGKTIAIVFDDERPEAEAEYTIYLLNRNGSNPRPVAVGSDPIFSPDGSRIAYTSHSDETGYQLAVMNADGSGQHLITPGSLVKFSYAPDWSADGTRLAFVRRWFDGRSTPAQIGTIRPDGTGSRIITAFPSQHAYDPYWSPDSRRIVFTAQSPTESEIWVMNRDGTGQQQLTDGHIDLHVTWSPNGAKLVFSSDRGPGLQLFTMSSAGGPARQVTQVPADSPEILRQWRPYWDTQHPG
jgi:Tol biopolymer transport system component